MKIQFVDNDKNPIDEFPISDSDLQKQHWDLLAHVIWRQVKFLVKNPDKTMLISSFQRTE